MNDILAKQIEVAPTLHLEDSFKYTDPGMFLEFGVSSGGSIKRIARMVTDIVWGFDSFEGLPEDFGLGRALNPKGSFKAAPPTDLPANVRLVKGLFQDTLPEFLATHDGPISFIHLDADLYSSTKFVLDQTKNRLDKTVLFFDEIYGLPDYEQHEGRAFREFLTETGYNYFCLGTQNGTGAGFKLYR